MRAHLIALVSFVVSCGQPARAPSATGGPAPRRDLHCTPGPDFDEPSCAARGAGCAWGPPLICRGVQAPPEILEEERRAYEEGTGPCRCVCPADHEACAMVP